MVDDAGLTRLHETARDLLEVLLGIDGRLQHGAVHNSQHSEFASRAKLLGRLLRSALTLMQDSEYGAALALLRGGIEHRVFDRLLYLADRYDSLTAFAVEDEQWAQWETNRPDTVLEWQRNPRSKRVRILWEGVPVRDEDGRTLYTLSAYYSHWKENDPFFEVRDYEKRVASYGDLADLAEQVRVQRLLRAESLSWHNLKRNLTLNGLASPTALVQLDVHYRFLSAFVHPFSLVAVRELSTNVGWATLIENDHTLEELVLLYVVWLAVDELMDFSAMSERQPTVGLAEWEQVREQLREAEDGIEHFWAPGRAPYSYDRVIEANARGMDEVVARMKAQLPMEVPQHVEGAALQADEVRYYDRPLRRLVELHRGFSNGMTRQTWVSPWPRLVQPYR